MIKHLVSRWMMVATAAIALSLFSGGDASAQEASRQPAAAMGTPQSSEESVPKQDAARLRTILDQNNTAQFAAYVWTFDRELMRPADRAPLNPDIERVIVEYFHNPQWQKPLMRFVSLRPYNSRALFDLLYEHIRDPDKVDPNLHWYNLICNTSQPNIEAPLLAAVPLLGTDGQDVILSCLSGRKYAPAVPAIRARIAETRGTRTEIGMFGYEWLAHIGNKDAADALVGELTRVHRMPSPTPADLAAEEAVLRALSSVPNETALDSALIVGLVSGKNTPALRTSYLRFLNARPDPAAANDLIGYLSDDAVRSQALDILYHMEAPEVWTRAIGAIDVLHAAGKLPDANYRYAKQLLSQRIEHPEALRQERSKAAANQAVEQEAAVLRSQRPSPALMQTDPRRYVEQALRTADALEAVADRYKDAPYSGGVRDDVLKERWIVALLQRFVLRQPREAIETNQKILAAPGRRAERNDLAATLQIAEVYRHELNDKAKALEYYQKARDAVDAQDWNGVRDPDIVKAWMKEGLIDREVSFLMTAKAFSGTVTRRDIEGSGVNLLEALGLLFAMGMPMQTQTVGGSDAAEWKSRVLTRLHEAPPSYLTTTATIMFIAVTGTTDVGGLFDTLNRSDPAHYVSACMLGAAALNVSRGAGQEEQDGAGKTDKGAMLRRVTAQFGKANHITIQTAPDPRRATPQATWDLFIASLKRGDRGTAAQCFSGPLRTSLAELFRNSSDADLLKMANEFGALQPPAAGFDSSKEFQEFGITRKAAQGDRAALVYFVRADDEWLVESM